MILDTNTLAILPISHINNRVDPFDRYFIGSPSLDESYRSVVNTGIQAYQLHTYLDLVNQYYGVHVTCLIYSQQLYAVTGISASDTEIRRSLALVATALGTKALRISTNNEEIEVPLEMNVALTLLLDDLQSPDYVSSSDQRLVQIGRIDEEVDWCFSQALILARDDITNSFEPMFTEARYASQ